MPIDDPTVLAAAPAFDETAFAALAELFGAFGLPPTW
ncbi:MAG: hypothetical protein QOK49_984 [Baekduia sp.]|jgi:hypothetical protein|nr:hypothetical protein [Baekduia sp.]